MSGNGLKVAAGLAVVSLGLGVYLSNRDKGADAAIADTALLPALEKRKDVAAVKIEGGPTTFTLLKQSDRWVVVEKAGYTANADRVQQLLVELRRARRLEQKTANPAGFEQLGVQDPGTEGATSKAVTLLDADGKEITKLIVGERRWSKGSATGPVRADDQSYVRVGGEANAWLAAGKLTIEGDPLRWLDQAICDVPRDRVAAARMSPTEGPALELARATKDEFEMKPVTVPEGREAKTPLGTSQVVNALTGLRFDDVAKADGFDWPAAPDVTTTFWTFDGLKVTAEVVERDGKHWAKLRAEVVDKSERPGVPGEALVGPPPLLAAETAAAPEQGADGAAAEGEAPAAPVGPTPEELAAEAAKINAAAGPWIFALPSWKATAFKLKLEDVLAPLPVDEEPLIEDADGSSDEGGNEGGVQMDPETPEESVEVPVQDPPTGDPQTGSGGAGSTGDGTTGG